MTFIGVETVTEFKVGVIIIKDYGGPYDWRKSGSAIRLAFEKVNSDILNDTDYRIVAIEKQYGPGCNLKQTPGNHFYIFKRKSVTSFKYKKLLILFQKKVCYKCNFFVCLSLIHQKLHFS